jgi:predicted transcriptional regulator
MTVTLPKGSRHGGCKGPRLEFDEVAVDRLIAGTLTASPTTAELHAAIIRLTKAQRSSREIAIQLAITVRTVCRHRAAERARHESVNCQEGAAA